MALAFVSPLVAGKAPLTAVRSGAAPAQPAAGARAESSRIAALAAAGATAALLVAARRNRPRRPQRTAVVLAAWEKAQVWDEDEEDDDDDEEDEYFEEPKSGKRGAPSPGTSPDGFSSQGKSTSSPFSSEAQSLDSVAPASADLVNANIPSHYLEVYRDRLTKNVSGGPLHAKGRSKRSKQKIEWRLKQGPPLAHDNWNFPSRLRVSTGTARRRRLEKPKGYIRPTMERVREALFNQVTTMHLFEDRSVRVLDLYSGTGSVGIEALSRGAAECVFVDSSKECVDCCIANAWMSGFMEHEEAAKGPMNERSKAETAPLMMVGGARAQVQIELHKAQVARQPVGAVLADAIDLLENPEKYGLVARSFNLITVSPPYNETSYRRLCTALAKTELLERDGLVCIEYPREMGAMPPILCAPFEDEEDADDLISGVPMLHGLRNRRYTSTMLAIYCRLPTGARGKAGEPRPWEFTETLIQKKLLRRSRELWRTPSLWGEGAPRGFSVKPKAPKLTK